MYLKIYIAGPFDQRPYLRRVRERLWAMGYEVTARWLDEPAKPPYMLQEAFERQTAIKDFCDISESDLLILDLRRPSTTGGRLVEFGFALAKLKAIYLIGEAESIFFRLADMRFRNWESCLTYLETLK
jgi:nucleoside 2-deoxyribosyltransferase